MWIDILPWCARRFPGTQFVERTLTHDLRPHLREQLITEMDWDKEFERFRVIHNHSVSVNWPYPLADILVSNSQDEISLNPLFEEHIRNLGNWSVGPKLVQEFSYARGLPTNPIQAEDVDGD